MQRFVLPVLSAGMPGKHIYCVFVCVSDSTRLPISTCIVRLRKLTLEMGVNS